MANSGLLLASNVTKVHSFFSKASQYVKKVLYIKLNTVNEDTITHQIVNVYSKVYILPNITKCIHKKNLNIHRTYC